MYLCISVDFFKYHAVLQIRKCNKDNLGIIFHISPYRHSCDPYLELSCQDGSTEGSKRFHREKRKIIFELSSIPHLIWSSDT